MVRTRWPRRSCVGLAIVLSLNASRSPSTRTRQTFEAQTKLTCKSNDLRAADRLFPVRRSVIASLAASSRPTDRGSIVAVGAVAYRSCWRWVVLGRHAGHHDDAARHTQIVTMVKRRVAAGSHHPVKVRSPWMRRGIMTVMYGIGMLITSLCLAKWRGPSFARFFDSGTCHGVDATWCWAQLDAQFVGWRAGASLLPVMASGTRTNICGVRQEGLLPTAS